MKYIEKKVAVKKMYLDGLTNRHFENVKETI
jgi:hypothetical protein